AAPHKNSFGCSNENDWTYFGKAYFDEALRKTYSFTQAFDLAKPLIEQREREHKFEPSEPQISLGSAIKEKLAALELQREHPASAAPTTTRAKTGSP
ncbi:MAG TPA: C13 family peptidase, partial [Usitatibacter sp.]|nr:C13 family peptidase [Usitatibacter sp.]